MRDTKQYQTVVLAALLHDIGKLLQRGSFGPLDITGRHPEVSGRFVSTFKGFFSNVADLPLLKTLVERHHESDQFRGLRVQEIEDRDVRSLAYLVSKADNLSSSERGERSEQWQDFKGTPLASVFGRVSISGDGQVAFLRYRASSLTKTKDAMPICPEDFDTYSPGEINVLLTSFGEEFREASSFLDIDNFDCVVTHLLALLHKYAWSIPSNTQESIPDVSLFDHLKTTAAIASCLYQFHSDNGTLAEEQIRGKANAFCLVVGDLSGIQDYIFDIATAGAGGVARRLRARSLLIQLLGEVAAHKILVALDLTFANIIMASGGKFYLLLPNTKAAGEVIRETQHEADQWLLKRFNGELGLNLASVTFGDEGFTTGGDPIRGFGSILKALSDKLAARKQHRSVEAFSAVDGWDAGVFLLDVHFEGQQACRSCGKFPISQEDLCTHCYSDRELGKIIPEAKYIAFFADESTGEIPLLGYSASVASTAGEIAPNPYLVLKLNDPSCVELGQYPALPKYLANYVPRAKDCQGCPTRERCQAEARDNPTELATFDCLAYSSRGRPLLGFLKADVDRLGEIFVFGLKRDEGGYDTISRLATLSRQLDLFFTGWVEHLTSTEYQDCYTVFSGGDDLFLVGPWNQILDLAECIKEDFAKYTGNPEMTLSAGVAVTKGSFPIARASQEANDCVDSSKAKGRNRFTLFGRTVTWSDWQFVKGQWEALRLRQKEMTSAFLYALLQYSEMWKKYSKWEKGEKDGDVLGLRFQPLLAWNLARNIDRRRSREIYQWAERLITWPVGEEAKRTLDNLGLIATLLILGREGGG